MRATSSTRGTAAERRAIVEYLKTVSEAALRARYAASDVASRNTSR